MKKLSLFVAMALAAAVNYSCGEYDNAVENSKIVFADENGDSHEVDLIASLQGTPGAEMEFSFSTFEDDYCAIVTGDYQTPATEVKANDDVKNSVAKKRTQFKFTVGDDGLVKVYGKSAIKTLYIGGGDQEVVVSFEQAKLANLEYLQIANAKIENIVLPALEKLGFLSIYRCIGLNNLNVTALQNLDTLYVRELKESNLTSLDLSYNKNLENIWIAGTASEKNTLSTIDLSNNTNLIRATVSYNNLSLIKFGGNYENLTNLTLTDNNLTELNLNGSFPNLKDLYVNKNKLAALDVSGLSALTTLNVSENLFTFATLPTENVYKNQSKNYSDQAKIKVALENNVLDLTDQLNVKGVETVYTINGATEIEDYVILAPGKFKFIKNLSNVVVSMTNEYFPGLTIETEPFDVPDPSNEVFVWEKKDNTEYVVGGTLVAVPAVSGVEPYTERIGYWMQQYATILIDGTTETLQKDKFNYIRVDLEEPLKEGMKVSFTGFRYCDGDAKANLYLLFNICDKDPENYLPNVFKPDYTGYTTFGYNTKYVFNNIKGSSLKPNTYTFEVTQPLVGAKSFKIVRNDAETEIYLTKISILRQ